MKTLKIKNFKKNQTVKVLSVQQLNLIKGGTGSTVSDQEDEKKSVFTKDVYATGLK